jgi:hypothetical protein
LEKDCAEKAATIELMKSLHTVGQNVSLPALENDLESPPPRQQVPAPAAVAQDPPTSDRHLSRQHVPSAVPNPAPEAVPPRAHGRGVRLLRIPQIPGRSMDTGVSFVPGFVTADPRYSSQIRRIYEHAISYHQQRREDIRDNFLEHYADATDWVLTHNQYKDLHPIGQQYELEKQLWKLYVGPPNATSNGFPCPDPMPCIRGDQPSKCAVCDNPGHWWWQCPEKCTRCFKDGHRYPNCKDGITWMVTRRNLIAATAAATLPSAATSTAHPQPQPQPQYPHQPQP